MGTATGEFLRLSKRIGPLTSGMLLIAFSARGQFYPDPKMTRAFEHTLKVWSKSQTRVFVTDCNISKSGSEKALLVFQLGSTTGTLVLASAGDVYNGAGVKIEKNGIVLVDAGGGEWSHRRLHDIAEQLVRFHFALMQLDDVRPFLNNKSINVCPEAPAER